MHAPSFLILNSAFLIHPNTQHCQSRGGSLGHLGPLRTAPRTPNFYRTPSPRFGHVGTLDFRPPRAIPTPRAPHDYVMTLPLAPPLCFCICHLSFGIPHCARLHPVPPLALASYMSRSAARSNLFISCGSFVGRTYSRPCGRRHAHLLAFVLDAQLGYRCDHPTRHLGRCPPHSRSARSQTRPRPCGP